MVAHSPSKNLPEDFQLLTLFGDLLICHGNLTTQCDRLPMVAMASTTMLRNIARRRPVGPARLGSRIFGNIPLAEAEAAYYLQISEYAIAA